MSEKETIQNNNFKEKVVSKERLVEILKSYYGMFGEEWNNWDFDFIIENNELVGYQRVIKLKD